jgi:membrane protein implicated in regulation of membrane protease activity
MFEPWFVWALIGIGCIGLEMLMPGFVIFFFGMGGLATALCSLVPSVAAILWLQILIFIVFSTLSLVFLRKRFSRIFEGTVFDSRKGNIEEAGIGKIAEVIETAGTVKEGRIRFQGTSWKAHTREGEIPSGSRARIIARESMTYIIEPADDSTGSTGGA